MSDQKELLKVTMEFFDYIKENKKKIRILFNESYGGNFTMRLVEHLCKGYIPVDDPLILRVL